MQDFISAYTAEISRQFASEQAREHGYRPALERLMNSFDDVGATNDPKRSAHGNPDMIFYKQSNHHVILGYAEAKDITVDLNKTVKTEQLHRYSGYNKLFLTNYLEFRFYRNGEEYEHISIGKLDGQAIHFDESQFVRLVHELQAFLELPPETIRSGRRLAKIMGGKARRIRDNVALYLKSDHEQNAELERIYKMMKQLLVHDLTKNKFADMYAQTLVYGLFVARYGDMTPESFDRQEARDLVPASNPFLRHFFDHIVGPNFDTRLSYIVDELCEIFSVSNVQDIVHKHLRIQDQTTDAKDPIIHFYEDFLNEYDPLERKKMGAYYTPIPVVKFIVRHVDKILKEDFGIVKGLASTETVNHWIETGQDHRSDKRKKAVTGYYKEMPRVQILDPAVGTATFLNETIKYIYEDFKGQEGRWPSYVHDNLVQRLFGFELMMAPYTIAHLKLGMTLKETGVETLDERLGVYLTNTLEEGVPAQQDLFSFGLAQAVSDESRHAAEIKSERPIMVVMGNPPYSVSSNNKSKYIENLLKDYKKDLNERNIQPLSDDYIKFIRFAEEMVINNGSGVVAMITNNSYINGIIHRQMRKHLLQTFNKIYILDLHGSQKVELNDATLEDENVFDIQQGVAIIILVKKDVSHKVDGSIYYSEIIGKRPTKFSELNRPTIDWQKIVPIAPQYFFSPKKFVGEGTYRKYMDLKDLFIEYNAGSATGKDKVLIADSKEELVNKLESENIIFSPELITPYYYRAWDERYTIYDKTIVQRLRAKIMDNLRNKDNLALITTKILSSKSYQHAFISNSVGDRCLISNRGKEANYYFPLWLYRSDGAKIANFNEQELKKFTVSLTADYSPEDIFDYIYAALHSPHYRKTYQEFLKIDFPRIPPPKDNSEFKRLVKLGHELRTLHLMQSPHIDNYATTFPVAGTNEVEKVHYEAGNVWINATQYFGNVPELAWNLYIGGYQPAQKWLKDRVFSKTDRPLSSDDLDHYQRIIKVLLETNRLMHKIDEQN